MISLLPSSQPFVSHNLYLHLKVLKRENVCYVVAPYEADAQMTFLAISKQVDAVITEDSDLIAFGCPRVSFCLFFWQVLLKKGFPFMPLYCFCTLL